MQTTLKYAALLWLGTLVTGSAVLAALYLYEQAVSAMRRKFGRRR